MIRFIAQNWHNLLWSAILLAIAVAVALCIHFVVFWVLRRLARRKGSLLYQALERQGVPSWSTRRTTIIVSIAARR